jgi:hypothetical protein
MLNSLCISNEYFCQTFKLSRKVNNLRYCWKLQHQRGFQNPYLSKLFLTVRSFQAGWAGSVQSFLKISFYNLLLYKVWFSLHSRSSDPMMLYSALIKILGWFIQPFYVGCQVLLSFWKSHIVGQTHSNWLLVPSYMLILIPFLCKTYCVYSSSRSKIMSVNLDVYSDLDGCSSQVKSQLFILFPECLIVIISIWYLYPSPSSLINRVQSKQKKTAFSLWLSSLYCLSTTSSMLTGWLIIQLFFHAIQHCLKSRHPELNSYKHIGETKKIYVFACFIYQSWVY